MMRAAHLVWGAATALALEDAETRLGWLVSGSRLDGVPFDRLDAELIAVMCDIAVPRLAAAEFDAHLKVLVEIDVGANRCGVAPGAAAQRRPRCHLPIPAV